MKKLIVLLAAAMLLSGCNVQAGSMPEGLSGSSNSSSLSSPSSAAAPAEEASAPVIKVLEQKGDAPSSGSASVSSSKAENSVNEEEEDMQSVLLKKTAGLLDLYREETDAAGKNVMLSPASLWAALGLTANGAEGETLKELEQFLGMDVQAVNKLFSQLQDDEVLKTANSMWYRDQANAAKEGRLTPAEEFRKTASNLYQAEAYECDFTDPATVGRINQWASAHTDGMIPEIIDRLEPNTAMVLLNALLFEGLWINPYDKSQVREETFRTSDGSQVQAQMLCSKESVYLENDKATGFIKAYEDGYYFVAALPKAEGAFTLEQLSLNTLLESAEHSYEVYAKLPKFSFSSGSSLVDLMKKAGVVQAFQEEKTDFSRMFQEDVPVWIGDVVQKTKIELTEAGTKAAAVTSVMMMAKTALIPDTMRREVYLDRPFAFLIMKEGLEVPLFAGIVEDPTMG